MKTVQQVNDHWILRDVRKSITPSKLTHHVVAFEALNLCGLTVNQVSSQHGGMGYRLQLGNNTKSGQIPADLQYQYLVVIIHFNPPFNE